MRRLNLDDRGTRILPPRWSRNIAADAFLQFFHGQKGNIGQAGDIDRITLISSRRAIFQRHSETTILHYSRED